MGYMIGFFLDFWAVQICLLGGMIRVAVYSRLYEGCMYWFTDACAMAICNPRVSEEQRVRLTSSSSVLWDAVCKSTGLLLRNLSSGAIIHKP